MRELKDPKGICTNIIKEDRENAAVIVLILEAYLSGVPLQRAHRTEDDWHTVHDLPTNFDEYRYRSPNYRWPG